MRLEYRPLAITGFTVFLVLFLSVYVSEDLSLASICAGALLFIITVIFKKLRIKIYPFFIAASLISGGMLFIVNNDYDVKNIQSFINGEVSHISGCLTDYPERSDSRYYYYIRVSEINGKTVDTDLRLSLPKSIEAEPFDIFEADVTLYSIGKSAGIDIERYFRSKGIVLGGYADSYDDDSVIIRKNDNKPFIHIFTDLRHTIEQRILEKLPNEYGGTVIALLLGDKSYISEELNDKIRLAGIASVFAVSGLHLSIWVMGLYSILEELLVKHRLKIIICLAFTLFFMALTGFSPSVCRSGFMMILLLAGCFFFLRSDSLNSLGFAVLVLCCINPFVVSDTGFLLSFAATFGIIVIYPVINNRFIKRVNNTGLRAIASALCVSFTAVIGALPVTVFCIGYLCTYTLITNLLVTYPAAVCMVAGGITAIFSNTGFISDISATVAGLVAKYIISVVEFVYRLPAKAVAASDIYWQCGVIIVTAVFIFAFLFFKGKTAVRFVSSVLAAVVLFMSVASYIHYNGLTRICVLDVGDGIAVTAANGNKKILLCGGAGGYNAYYAIEDELNSLSRRDPDLILLSDDTTAESASFLSILNKFEFNNILIPYKSQTVRTLVDENDMTVGNETSAELWEGANLYYYAREDSSYCYCDLNGITFFIIFSSDKNSEYDERFLTSDFLVCREYIPNGIDVSKFGRVIVSTYSNSGKPIYDYVERRGGKPASTFNSGNIYIDVKNGKYKIYTREG